MRCWTKPSASAVNRPRRWRSHVPCKSSSPGASSDESQNCSASSTGTLPTTTRPSAPASREPTRRYQRLEWTVMASPSLKRSARGSPSGSVWRYAGHFREPGPGVLPWPTASLERWAPQQARVPGRRLGSVMRSSASEYVSEHHEPGRDPVERVRMESLDRSSTVCCTPGTRGIISSDSLGRRAPRGRGGETPVSDAGAILNA